jgi:phage terminase large subunit
VLEIAIEALRVWRADPKRMVRDLFGVTPDAWQARALDAWASGRARERIAMQACAGPGKSAAEAWMGWNALLCYSDGVDHPQGAAVSITGENLKNGLWKELAYWREKSSVLQRAFEMTAERIFARAHPLTWFLGARSFAKAADANAQGRTLSGLHAKRIFYLVDESGDMPPTVLRSAEQGLSNCEWGRIAQAGNPTNLEGALYQAVSVQSHLWTPIRITGDPEDPERSPRIDLEWAREQIRLYSRDNPWVMAFILGKFPPSSLNTLLGPDDVHAAIGRQVEKSAYENVQKRIGIDVARFGDDRTILFPRQGLVAHLPVILRHRRTHEIAARIATGKAKWGSEAEFIDNAGGWAAGVIDQCLLGGITLYPVNPSGEAGDPRYFNKRSEMHFLAADWVKKGGALPPGVPELVREATAAHYWFDNGKLRVEEKEQIKKLIGNSPDLWDGLLQTFAMPDMPALLTSMPVVGGRGAYGNYVSEYEPFADGRA